MATRVRDDRVLNRGGPSPPFGARERGPVGVRGDRPAGFYLSAPRPVAGPRGGAELTRGRTPTGSKFAT